MKQDLGISFWIIIIVCIGLLVLFSGVLYKVFMMNDENKVESNSPVSTETGVVKNEGGVSAVIKTNMGSITLELFKDKSPNTVDNFVKLASSGFYDGTKFHRVIKDFMIQGGDPNSRNPDWSTHGMGGPGYAFNDEFNDVPLVAGVLAMANAGPNTNGSQFFIVTAESTPWLDGKHTAFGRVTDGMDVVKAIEAVSVDHNRGDHPIVDVIVEKVIIE